MNSTTMGRMLRWLAVALCAGAGQAAAAGMGPEEARHLLARTGFGPTLAEVRAVSALDRREAVERLLASPPKRAQFEPPAWTEDTEVLVRRQRTREESVALNAAQLVQVSELRGWWLTEMITTPAPLLERMTLFWHNHFTSGRQKVRFPQLMYRQNALLREHALGSFATLLHAASKDPAMIIYLDSASNRRGKPNENFAREVMELFTLGEGHYSEADIREAARAFTGWSLDVKREFMMRRALHDSGEKTILGRRGSFNGDDVLDLLLEQPRTAEFIVEKLWREFVSPHPQPAEVARIAGVFRASGYETRAALRELLLSPAFWAPANHASLIKSPAEYVAGMLRQFAVPVANTMPFATAMAGMGQALFDPPNVKGWPGGESWINAATLLARKQFAERLLRVDDRAMSRGAERAGAMGAASADKGGMEPGMASSQAAPSVQRAAAVLRTMTRQPAPTFDSTRWLAEFSADGVPTVETLLLAAAPVHSMPDNVGGIEWLRQLTLDPSYQLK
jgi:uncharacterized protein (DUF1800 family)